MFTSSELRKADILNVDNLKKGFAVTPGYHTLEIHTCDTCTEKTNSLRQSV